MSEALHSLPVRKRGATCIRVPWSVNIASGTGFYQIEGEPTELLPVGSAFYEPAQRVIADFGNASDVTPLTFIAFYLLDGEQDLITMLDSK